MVQYASRVAFGPIVIAAVAFAGGASAQTMIHHFVGNAPGEQFGGSVAVVADVDGDGLADIAASSPLAASNFGVVRVFSSATGSLLWQVQGTIAGSRFGTAIAALGDIDGDGRGDIAVGAYLANFPGAIGAGAVRLFSGASGALIREHRGDGAADHYGWSVGNAGDVDGDGVDDLIAGAVDDGISSAGTARVHSGATGSTLMTVAGTTPQQIYGSAVAGVGDVNGDGRGDFVVGGPYFASSLQTGMARLHSGANGAVLFTWTGTEPHDSLGGAAAGVGDVDGDQVPDVLVGARQLQTGRPGYARVYSGASGALIRELVGDATSRFFGTSVAPAGDVDYDGRGDFLVGTPSGANNGVNSGLARLFSGADGTVLHDFVGAAANAKLGGAIAGGLDLSGNGAPDLVLGAIGDATAGLNAGGVFAYTGSDVPPPDLSQPLEADVLEVSISQSTVQHLALDAGTENAGAYYVILGSASGTSPGFSASGLTVALNPDPYMRYTLRHPHHAPLQGSRGFLDAAGEAEATFQPRRAWRASCMVGRTFHHAYLVLGDQPRKMKCKKARAVITGGLEAEFVSNTVAVTIVP